MKIRLNPVAFMDGNVAFVVALMRNAVIDVPDVRAATAIARGYAIADDGEGRDLAVLDVTTAHNVAPAREPTDRELAELGMVRHADGRITEVGAATTALVVEQHPDDPELAPVTRSLPSVARPAVHRPRTYDGEAG